MAEMVRGRGGGEKKRSGRGLIKKSGKEDREGKGGGKHRNETRQRNVVAVSEERVYKKKERKRDEKINGEREKER